MADEVTKKKIRIVRGKQNILRELLSVIDKENIPPEFGGSSVPLGQSPEEKQFAEDMRKNLRNANTIPVRVP